MPTLLLGGFAALLLAVATATPARAQIDDPDVTPSVALAQAWSESLYGAEAVARALDDVAADTVGASAEAVGEAGRARALAAVASAASATSLALSLQFTIALADPAERPTISAAIGEESLGLHMLLLMIAETVHPPPDDPTLTTAPARTEDGAADEDMQPEAEDWGGRAAQIREIVGHLRGATAALGLIAP